jgi:sec-independent protein translocase protein TatA
MVSGNEWIIVVLVVALIFGATRLPLLGRNLGQGIKEFKKGIAEARSDKDKAPKGSTLPPADPSVNGTPGPDGTDTGPGRIADRRD